MNDFQTNIESYISTFFENEYKSIFTYHNLEHTQRVVKYSNKIADELNINEQDKDILIAAAWFHDTGYFENYADHENISARIASKYLQEQNCTKEFIDKVCECIVYTKFPHEYTSNILANILCDADMYHTSTKNYIKVSEQFLEETRNITKHKISKKLYWENTLYFLKEHKFKSEYAKKNLAKKKELNIKRVVEIVNGYQTKEIQKLNNQLTKLEQTNEKLRTPQRGVETLFRLTARNQINLSSIADNKANLMISVNSIIISATFFLFKNIWDFPQFIIPCLILASFSLITIIYSVLATRPNISTGTFTKEDVDNKKVNLLFFGNFFKMELPDYSKALKSIMTDYDGLYDSLIKDQYNLGIVLGRKYKMLRIAYNLFMYGLICSVLAFVIAALLNTPGA